MAIGCLSLCFITSGALVWRSLQSTVTPYVVEVDETGAARAVAPAAERYVASDAQIAHHLANFIAHVRGLSVDPVVVISVVRVSDDSFQARWIEKTYENGALMKAQRFTGLFSIVTQSPKDAATLRANPLGLYINSLNWGEDLVTGD